MMDAPEPIDREIIVERAEAVLEWLAGLGLSSRALGALQRELQGIIANDPGGYINGHRPLAGLTVADIMADVHRPNGGALGHVKSVGDGVLAELRAALPADGAASDAQPAEAAAASDTPPAELRAALPADGAASDAQLAEAAAASDAPPAEPEGRRPRRRSRRAEAPNEPAAPGEAEGAAQAEPERASPPVAVEAAEPASPGPEDGAATDTEQAPPRRPRGRPKGSTNASRRKPEAPQATPRMPEPAPPPAAAASAPTAVPKVAPAEADQLLGQLSDLWPSLHPQARRAIVFYASGLLIEGAYNT